MGRRGPRGGEPLSRDIGKVLNGGALKHPRRSRGVSQLWTTSRQKNSQNRFSCCFTVPAALKLAGNISDGLMVPHPTSRIKADHYLLPGQPCTVCKYFIRLSLAGGWKPLRRSMLLDSQCLGAASETLHWHNIPLSGAIEAGR